MKHPALCLSLLAALALTACQKSYDVPTFSAQPGTVLESPLPVVTATPAPTQTAAPSPRVDGAADIEITEEMYANWVNEINYNGDAYLGQTISIQGMFAQEKMDTFDAPFNYVYRIGPGCCGFDGSICGFMIVWDGETPAPDDWIDVRGTVRIVDVEGMRFLGLDDCTVTVDNEHRGAENVTHRL